MGWDGIRAKLGGKRTDREATAAVAAAAAQLPAACVFWWLAVLGDDPYGRGDGGALGLLFVVLLAPLYVPVLGLLHAFAQILPGAALADLTLGRFRWPLWARQLTGAAVTGAGWALTAALLWDRPFAGTAGALTVLAVVPVLAMAYARRRGPGTWGVWWRAAAGSCALLVLAFLGGALAHVTGLAEEYVPPRLSTAQVAGVWRGEDGAELRLLGDGQAVLTRMPAEAEPFEEADLVVCDGTGTWSFDPDREDGRWDDVRVRLETGSGGGSRCGDETAWTVGGTDRAPELFVVFGDPDGGELRILTRAVDG